MKDPLPIFSQYVETDERHPENKSGVYDIKCVIYSIVYGLQLRYMFAFYDIYVHDDAEFKETFQK